MATGKISITFSDGVFLSKLRMKSSKSTNGEVFCQPTVTQQLTSYNDIILGCLIVFVVLLSIFFVVFLKRQKVLCFEEECTEPVDKTTNRGKRRVGCKVVIYVQTSF